MTKTQVIINYLITYPLARRTPNGNGKLTAWGSKINPFPKGTMSKVLLRSTDVGELKDLNKKTTQSQFTIYPKHINLRNFNTIIFYIHTMNENQQVKYLLASSAAQTLDQSVHPNHGPSRF